MAWGRRGATMNETMGTADMNALWSPCSNAGAGIGKTMEDAQRGRRGGGRASKGSAGLPGGGVARQYDKWGHHQGRAWGAAARLLYDEAGSRSGYWLLRRGARLQAQHLAVVAAICGRGEGRAADSGGWVSMQLCEGGWAGLGRAGQC